MVPGAGVGCPHSASASVRQATMSARESTSVPSRSNTTAATTTSDLPTSDLPASDLPTSDLPASDLPASDLPASDLRGETLVDTEWERNSEGPPRGRPFQIACAGPRASGFPYAWPVLMAPCSAVYSGASSR